MKSISTLLFLLVFSFNGFTQVTHNWSTVGIDSTFIGGALSPQCVERDVEGNIYISGVFSYSTDLDPSTNVFRLYSNGDFDVYLAKYDSLGNFIYAKSFGGPGYDSPTAMSIAGDRTVYLCGTFSDTADFDPGVGIFNLGSSTASPDNFIVKLNPAGTFVDAKRITLGTFGKIRGCLVQTSGLYICGGVGLGNDFDPGPGVSTATISGTQDAYYAKYDASMNLISFHDYGGPGADWANTICINYNLIVIGGAFEQTASFNTTYTAQLSSWGGTEIFLAAYDNITDAYVVCTRLGGTGNDELFGLDKSGNDIYWCGKVAGNSIDVDTDPSGSSFLTSAGGEDIGFGAWVPQFNSGGGYMIGGTGNDCATDIHMCEVGFDNQFTICGYFSGSFDFDVSVFTRTGVASNTGDLFIATYGGNTVFDCNGLMVCEGIGHETTREFAVGNNRHIFAAGAHSAGVDLDPYNGVVTPVNPAEGIFLASYTTLCNYRWSKTFGLNDTLPRRQEVRKVVKDANNYSYVCGMFSGTVDMDPGPGVVNIRSTSPTYQSDMFFAKYSPTGSLVWVKTIGAMYREEITGIALDPAGNIYIAGQFVGTIDFDPGPATNTLTSAGAGADIFFAKYDNNGNYVMAKWFGVNVKSETCNGISVDALGNIYLIGEFETTVDFNPGAGVNNLVSAGNTDVYVAKYSTAGNYMFAFRLGNNAFDLGSAIELDQYNNIYLAGAYSGTIDFDPGTGTTNTSAGTNGAGFIAKYTSAGVYISVKLLAQGAGASSVRTTDIAVDHRCNVFITGNCTNTVDFDPSAATANVVTQSGIVTPFVAGYDSTGAYTYARIFYTLNNSSGLNIDVDSSQSAYVCGYFQNTMNFNYGSGTYNLISSYDDDGFVAKYSSSGAFVYAFNIGGGGKDWIKTLCVNGTGSDITTGGYFNNTVDFDPSGASYSFTSSNTNDLFVSNYSAPCSGPPISGSISGSTTVCENASTTYSISPIAGASTYTWTLPSGWVGTSSTNSITALAGTSGTVSVVANNSCGSSLPITLNVTVNPAPVAVITASPSSAVCAGTSVTLTAAGAASYSWTGSVVNGVPFNAVSSQTYTVTATGSNGCQDTESITLTVNPNPVAAATSSPGSNVCTGSSVTLNGTTPSSTYSWSGGVTDGVSFIPGATQTYVLTVSDANSCTDTMHLTIYLQNVPTVSISASPDTVVCSGNVVTLTGSGALSYVWSNGVVNGIPFTATTTSTYTLIGSNAPGCEDTLALTLHVNPSPNVSYTETMDTTCLNGSAFTLSQGVPLGGIYSGPGVTGNTFNPFSAGAGLHSVTYVFTDTNGCSSNAASTVFVDVCTDIVAETPTRISLYPNPAQEYVYLIVPQELISAGSGNLTIQVVNSLGQIVSTATLDNTTVSINVAFLPSGVYELQIANSTNHPLRFIKE